jgi:hypothetical protein
MEPLEEKWGRWTIWKCICHGFISGALQVCAHSLMMYDKFLTSPSACSSKKLWSRAKGTRRPSAWAPENEDVEDSDEPTRKQQWCPVTMASDGMELEPLPRKKHVLPTVFSYNVNESSDDASQTDDSRRPIARLEVKTLIARLASWRLCPCCACKLYFSSEFSLCSTALGDCWLCT